MGKRATTDDDRRRPLRAMEGPRPYRPLKAESPDLGSSLALTRSSLNPWQSQQCGNSGRRWPSRQAGPRPGYRRPGVSLTWL